MSTTIPIDSSSEKLGVVTISTELRSVGRILAINRAGANGERKSHTCKRVSGLSRSQPRVDSHT